jgi:hypothetical protein
MAKQNVTLSIPKDVLRKARMLAIERNTSLSRLVTQFLIDMVEEEDKYKAAMQRHLTWLEHSADLGTGGRPTWMREELHE